MEAHEWEDEEGRYKADFDSDGAPRRLAVHALRCAAPEVAPSFG